MNFGLWLLLVDIIAIPFLAFWLGYDYGTRRERHRSDI
jgi:hypothetical protein